MISTLFFILSFLGLCSAQECNQAQWDHGMIGGGDSPWCFQASEFPEYPAKNGVNGPCTSDVCKVYDEVESKEKCHDIVKGSALCNDKWGFQYSINGGRCWAKGDDGTHSTATDNWWVGPIDRENSCQSASWIFGEPGDSCDTACANAGLICEFSSEDVPLSVEDLQALDMECTSYADYGCSWNGPLKHNGLCLHWNTAPEPHCSIPAGALPSCSHVGYDGNYNYERLCRCVNIDLPVCAENEYCAYAFGEDCVTNPSGCTACSIVRHGQDTDPWVIDYNANCDTVQCPGFDFYCDCADDCMAGAENGHLCSCPEGQTCCGSSGSDIVDAITTTCVGEMDVTEICSEAEPDEGCRCANPEFEDTGMSKQDCEDLAIAQGYDYYSVKEDKCRLGSAGACLPAPMGAADSYGWGMYEIQITDCATDAIQKQVVKRLLKIVPTMVRRTKGNIRRLVGRMKRDMQQSGASFHPDEIDLINAIDQNVDINEAIPFGGTMESIDRLNAFYHENGQPRGDTHDSFEHGQVRVLLRVAGTKHQVGYKTDLNRQMNKIIDIRDDEGLNYGLTYTEDELESLTAGHNVPAYQWLPFAYQQYLELSEKYRDDGTMKN